MFIVIDGIDGSGKGTQVELLKNYYENKGLKIKILDYPRYDYDSSLFVKKYLNGEYGKNVSPKISSLFYALDRYDSFFGGEKINLNKYDIVISNRYVSANMIHQASKIKDEGEFINFLKWLEDLEYNIFGIPKPDLIIFLNVPAYISKNMLEKKGKREYIKGGKNLDIHEEDINHLENAHKKALKIVEIFDNWKQIDCSFNGEILDKKVILKKICDVINYQFKK